MVIPENSPAQGLFSKVKDLPSLPQLYHLIRKEVNDPDSSIVRIGELISTDSALTARLLKLANSSAFGFSQKIDTIAEALTILGLQQVRDLSLSTMVLGVFSNKTSDLIDMQAFWKHGLGCGVSARVLAVYKRLSNVEKYFVNGLMHDLGRLLMLMTLPNEMHEILCIARERHEMVYVVEREVLGYDHGEAGAILMQTWGLPELAIEAAYLHHRPDLSVKFEEETSLIHVADIISHAMELGSSGENLMPPLNDKVWNKMGLKPTSLASMMKDIDRQCDEVYRIMLK